MNTVGITFREGEYRVHWRCWPLPYCSGGHVEVIKVVRMEGGQVKVRIDGKEGPLSPSVSLHGLHCVVADDSIHVPWWGR